MKIKTIELNEGETGFVWGFCLAGFILGLVGFLVGLHVNCGVHC